MGGVGGVSPLIRCAWNIWKHKISLFSGCIDVRSITLRVCVVAVCGALLIGVDTSLLVGQRSQLLFAYLQKFLHWRKVGRSVSSSEYESGAGKYIMHCGRQRRNYHIM